MGKGETGSIKSWRGGCHQWAVRLDQSGELIMCNASEMKKLTGKFDLGEYIGPGTDADTTEQKCKAKIARKAAQAAAKNKTARLACSPPITPVKAPMDQKGVFCSVEEQLAEAQERLDTCTNLITLLQDENERLKGELDERQQRFVTEYNMQKTVTDKLEGKLDYFQNGVKDIIEQLKTFADTITNVEADMFPDFLKMQAKKLTAIIA